MLEKIYSGKASLNIAISLSNLHQISYQPTAVEEGIHVWTTYFSLLVPIWYIGRATMRYAFANKLFKTRVIFRVGNLTMHENSLTTKGD
jgi:Transmembrane protein 231